jgi:hypothetical protein
VHRNTFSLDILTLQFYTQYSILQLQNIRIIIIVAMLVVVLANGFDIIDVCQEEALLMLWCSVMWQHIVL